MIRDYGVDNKGMYFISTNVYYLEWGSDFSLMTLRLGSYPNENYPFTPVSCKLGLYQSLLILVKIQEGCPNIDVIVPSFQHPTYFN